MKFHQFINPFELTAGTWKWWVSNRNLLFQGFIFRFHVSFPGCSGFHGRIILEESFTGLCDGQLVEIFKLPKDDLSPNIPTWVKSSNQRQGEDADAGAGFFRKRCFFLVLKNGTRWVFKGVWCWCFLAIVTIQRGKGEFPHELMTGGSSARYQRAPWDLQWFMDKNPDVVATDFWKKKKAHVWCWWTKIRLIT